MGIIHLPFICSRGENVLSSLQLISTVLDQNDHISYYRTLFSVSS